MLDGFFEKAVEGMLTIAIENAIRRNHRRLVVVSGSDYQKKAELTAKIITLLAKLTEKRELKGCYMAAKLDEGKRSNLTYNYIRGLLSKALKDTDKRVEIDSELFMNTTRLMGTTNDFIILDLWENMEPNDIGRLVETVRGGGLVIFLTPSFSQWKDIRTNFQHRLVTPPYTINDVVSRFLIRFIRKLLEHEGIYIFDADKEVIIKGDRELFQKPQEKRPIEFPSAFEFPKEVYKLAATQDQVRALKLLENLLKKTKKKMVIVITADRGRGKSAVLGMALAAIAHLHRDRRLQIIVTAPEAENVQQLFKFYMTVLDILGYKYNVVKWEDNIEEVHSSVGSLIYARPWYSLRRKGDIIAVDEAAGIPVPVLWKLLERYKLLVFSSTTHGYEGAGRGFSIRFLGALREKKDIELHTLKIEEPIRYAEEDPIEKWLFDTLLLDAEPVDLTSQDLEDVKSKNVRLVSIDKDVWFVKGQRQDEMRQFVGIYVYAHYRNRPNDVALLADAPHHKAFALKTGTRNAIVNALQVAEEGSLPDEIIDKIYYERYDPPGNIIPDIVIEHHRTPEFGKLKGLRIVRIATHPQVMDRGLGSKALEMLCKYAEEAGYDWVGSVFGASDALLKFWKKNGFLPVYVSPERNPVSGEFSVVVIKPLSKKAKEIVFEMHREFRAKMIDLLADILRDMEPEVAVRLLEPVHLSEDFDAYAVPPPELTRSQWERLNCFAEEILPYNAVVDAIKKITIRYFLHESAKRPTLNRKQKFLLILKILQAKPWDETADALKKSVKWCIIELEHIIRNFLKHYIPPPHILDTLGVRYSKLGGELLESAGREDEEAED
ncbi:MAG: tRNA(Met) cytidine acetyltransferase TmcA [Candidatus Baldrarchaeia archaeon]